MKKIIAAIDVLKYSESAGIHYSIHHEPDNMLMKEFMKRHFPNPECTLLKGIAAFIHYTQ